MWTLILLDAGVQDAAPAGGASRLESHILRHWSTTQSTVALSFAEAELTSICRSSSICIGLKALCPNLGLGVKLRIHSDATAAIGMARRRGLGKVRHLAVADLWIQHNAPHGGRNQIKIYATNQNTCKAFVTVAWKYLCAQQSETSRIA